MAEKSEPVIIRMSDAPCTLVFKAWTSNYWPAGTGVNKNVNQL